MTIHQIFKVLEKKAPDLFIEYDISVKCLPLTIGLGLFLHDCGLNIRCVSGYSNILFLTERAKDIKVTISKRPHTTHTFRQKDRSTYIILYRLTPEYDIAINCINVHICPETLMALYGKIPKTLYFSIPPTEGFKQ